jgi:hypothetical protein
VDPQVFVASRLTAGNFLFPTRIVVAGQSVHRRKRSWFTVAEESVHIGKIANVNITTGILWSDIRIESTGGSDPIESHGHTKADARQIKRLIEGLQAQPQGGATPEDLRPCPHCAEPIRRAAKVCRFCGRDVAT